MWNYVLRMIVTLVAALIAMGFYCASQDIETVPLSGIVLPFLLPSVALFLLIEKKRLFGIGKYAGFFLPAIVIYFWSSYELWRFHQQELLDGGSDGGDELLKFFLMCYSIGMVAALVVVHFGRKQKRGAGEVTATKTL